MCIRDRFQNIGINLGPQLRADFWKTVNNYTGENNLNNYILNLINIEANNGRPIQALKLYSEFLILPEKETDPNYLIIKDIKLINKIYNNSIEKVIWFAGLADKWEQLSGNLNPVSGDFFNISHQNPIGVVFSLNKDNNSLYSLLSGILPPLTVGCSVISFSETSSILALKFAEDINNSDIPGGTLNILSGNFNKVSEDISKHAEINLISIHEELDTKELKEIEENASESVKRVKYLPQLEGLSSILPYLSLIHI